MLSKLFTSFCRFAKLSQKLSKVLPSFRKFCQTFSKLLPNFQKFSQACPIFHKLSKVFESFFRLSQTFPNFLKLLETFANFSPFYTFSQTRTRVFQTCGSFPKLWKIFRNFREFSVTLATKNQPRLQTNYRGRGAPRSFSSDSYYWQTTNALLPHTQHRLEGIQIEM